MDAKSSQSVGGVPCHEDGKPNDPLVLTTEIKPTILMRGQFSDGVAVSTPGRNRETQKVTLNCSKGNKPKVKSKIFSVKKELVPLKLVLVCWFGAFFSVSSYLTIFFKHLGVTAAETAFIFSFYPLAKLLGPALAGLIADKLGRYKPVLFVSLVLSIIFSFSFVIVPSVPEATCQKNVKMLCWKGNSSKISTQLCCPESVCELLSEINETDIVNCTYGCREFKDDVQLVKLCLNEEIHKECSEDNRTSIEVKTDRKIYKNICLRASNLISHNEFSLCSTNYEEQNCSTDCDIAMPVGNSTFQCKQDWYDRVPALGVIFFVFMGFQFFAAISFSLVETIALAMVKEHNDDYGRQRFWSILSTAVFTPLTGILIDVASKNNGYEDYSPAFYLFNALIVMTIIFVYVLDLPLAPPAKQLRKDIIQLFKSVEVIIFLLAIFFLGSFLGFQQSFLFWYLQDLGSPKYLLGLTVTVGCIAGLPFLCTSKWFVGKLGRANLLIAAFVFYFIQLFGYSYIYIPWWFVLFESMAIFTNHLMWVATATYAASISPEGLLATVQGIVAGIHYGIGRGSGTFIGGNLVSAFGNRIAFRSMGIAAGIIGVVYASLYWLYIRRMEKKRQESADPQQRPWG